MPKGDKSSSSTGKIWNYIICKCSKKKKSEIMCGCRALLTQHSKNGSAED